MRLLRLLMAGILLASTFAVQAHSQAPAGLGPQSKATLATLDELSHLPGGGWRYHAGDVPHGESVDLDDSSWRLIGDHEDVGRDAGWFRRTVEVPSNYHGYDLTGARLSFKFIFDWSGDRTQIIYIDGNRVAMGDDLEPIVLPGMRIQETASSSP